MTTTLEQFLSAPERPNGTMNYPEMHGFLFAVACSPEMIEPSEWLEMIFNEEDAQFADEDEAELIISTIVDIYNEIVDEVLENRPVLPACCRILTPAMENFGENSSLAAWARGFLDGHEWLSEIWETCLPKELDEELGACLMMLFFFADRELAVAFRDHSENNSLTVDKLAETCVGSFENAMMSYAHIGHAIRNVISEKVH